jgi:hypothetical protein
VIPGNASITVLRRTLTPDRYGDLQPTGEATRTVITGCLVSPRSSADLTSPGRQGVLIGLSVIAPASADILSDDQVEVDGALFDISGDIGRWRSPFSRLGGLEFALTRAVG